MATQKQDGFSKVAIEFIEEKNFGHIATIMKDGSPQVTPVWIDHQDGKYLLVNTALGRVKERNVRRDRRVAISIVDHRDPYRRVVLRGKVVQIVKGKTAEEHIDKLAKKYLGKDKYPSKAPGEQRILLKIKPEHETLQM